MTETFIGLSIALVLVAIRFLYLYTSMMSPRYGAARLLKIDDRPALEVVKMLRNLEHWEGVEVLETKDEALAVESSSASSSSATPSGLRKRTRAAIAAATTTSAPSKYASKFAVTTPKGRTQWTASVMDSQPGKHGINYRYFTQTEQGQRRWLFSVVPLSPKSCLLTLGETGTAPSMQRVVAELVWGGYFWEIDSFLRKWGQKILPEGEKVVVYAADKTPEDIRAALAWKPPVEEPSGEGAVAAKKTAGEKKDE